MTLLRTIIQRNKFRQNLKNPLTLMREGHIEQKKEKMTNPESGFGTSQREISSLTTIQVGLNAYNENIQYNERKCKGELSK